MNNARNLAPGLLVAGAFAFGCNGSSPAQPVADITALDIELVQDPALNSPTQVAQGIDQLLITIESPEQLYPPGSERTEGAISIRDTNSDGRLDIQVSRVVDNGRLPSIRLMRARLPNVPLSITVRGLLSAVEDPKKSYSIAAGGVEGVRFQDGLIASVPVFFNIRPEWLPPRVTSIQPTEGPVIRSCSLSEISVFFSKEMDPKTVNSGSIRIEPGGPPTVIELDSTGFVAKIVPSTPSAMVLGGATPEKGTLSYRVAVSSDAKDRQGINLDYIPGEPGNQSYSEDFSIPCEVITTVPGTCDPDAGPAATPCPEGKECVNGTCRKQGTSCAPPCDSNSVTPPCSKCVTGFVCNPVANICEVDCRSYGTANICPSDRPVCDPQTGACLKKN